MRLGAVVLLLSVLCCGSAVAQDLPRVEVFGGYSYVNVDTNGFSDRQNANGWEASVSGNFNERFAVEGSVAGYYKTFAFDFVPLGLGTVDVHVHDYSYMAGPRVNYRPFFVHALFGGDHLSGSAQGVSASQDSFAAAFGGGVQWNLGRQWAVRGSADYVVSRHNLSGSSADTFTQNNFRASVGVVYFFGRVRERSRPQRSAAAPCTNPSEVAVFGITGCATGSGFEIASVQAGSLASVVGISPGDALVSIDGRAVRNSSEIEQAIRANATGTIRVGYLVKGNWLIERDVRTR